MNPSLRTRLIMSFSGVITLSVILILLFMHQFINARIAHDLATQARTQEDVLRHLHAIDTSRQILRFETLASEPRLRALVSLDDPDTLSHQADELAREHNCRHVSFLSPTGVPRATSQAKHDSATSHLAAIADHRINTNTAARFAVYQEGTVLNTVTVPIRVDNFLSAILVLSDPVSQDDLLAFERTMNASRLLLNKDLDDIDAASSDIIRHVAFNDGFRYSILLDRAHIEGPLRSIFINVALIGLISILATVFIAVILARRMSKPIDGLAAVAAAVREGNLSVRSPVSGSREVRQLADSFNRMLDNIAASQDELKRGAVELRNRMEEREALQAQLIQAQKMEAIGRVAGGVSHDFNNLLTVIIGNCQLAMADTPRDNPTYHDLEQVLKASERAAELTRQLLVFSRKQTVELLVMNLNDAVLSMESMLNRILGENVVFTTELSDDLHAVRADPGRIEQVLMNLVVNACDAMENDGTLTIETCNVSVSSAPEAERLGTTQGQFAALRVIDTGSGMNAETQAHIFEPFFTTKDKERGTGLGLSTVYGILQHMGASITVESVEGQGSVFQILFKRANRADEGTAVVVEKNLALQGTETILVVDDEDYIVDILSKALADNGYRVITASNAEDAITVASRPEQTLDLLIADIALPGMDGPELCDVLIEKIPSLKTIHVTGYDDDPTKREHYRTPYESALRKPFSVDQLLLRVRETLDD